MRIEKWIYKGQEVEVPVLEDDEIEKNINVDSIETTQDLTEELKNIGDINEQ